MPVMQQPSLSHVKHISNIREHLSLTRRLPQAQKKERVSILWQSHIKNIEIGIIWQGDVAWQILSAACRGMPTASLWRKACLGFSCNLPMQFYIVVKL
jgi:hypothetical protein